MRTAGPPLPPAWSGPRHRDLVTGFPLLLDLTGRRVLVVGGGAVATRRAERLAESGAVIEVVAPTVSNRLRELGARVAERAFEPGDVHGAWLVLACTDSPAVNASVAAAAAAEQIFCVRADAAGGGSARTPALTRRDGVTIAVSGGDDPRRAVALRDAISAALDLGQLPLRSHRPASGSVALVGGGPGDPELITVRGRRLIASADVIVVDRLAPRALLDELSPDVEVIDCGKSAHRHNLTQDEINAVLVDRARAGKRVVRLKGGDPFVFGRGGEEWLACLAAGVAVTVVPGVSSALAAPVAAGIPLTHRGLAADFTVASGHLDPGRPPDTGLDWAALARASTLVLLMSIERLDLIVKELVSHGRDPQTPAAVIERATLDGQQIVRAPLEQLPAEVIAEGVRAPAVVVVGDVVNALASNTRSQ
jgi:uroporphyrin-III C-methyltransferase / precorrin-2 dehydrogenase / sirohydrochlorin ferrochelatase